MADQNVKIGFEVVDKNFIQGLTTMSKNVDDFYKKMRQASSMKAGGADMFEILKLDLDKKIKEYEKIIDRVSRASKERGVGSEYKAAQEQLSGFSGARDRVEELAEQKFNEEKRERLERRVENKNLSKEEREEKRRQYEEEREDRRRGNGRDARIVDVIQIARTLAQSRDTYSAIGEGISGTGMLFKNPIVGAGTSLIGGLFGRGISSGEEYMRAAANLSQIGGMPLQNYIQGNKLNNTKNLSVQQQIYNDVYSKWYNTVVDVDAQAMYGSVNGKPRLKAKPSLDGRLVSKTEIDREEKLINQLRVQIAAEQKKINEDVYSNDTKLDLARKMGYNPAQYLEMRGKMSRQQGFIDTRGSAIGAMQLIKGLGLDEGLVSGLTRTGRSSGATAMEMTTSMFGNLASRLGKDKLPLMSREDTSKLPEYLQILVETNQKQLEKLGSVDRGINEGMIASIATLGKNFANPDLLKTILPKFQQGFGESQNPQVKALQYQTMSDMGVGNIFEMRKIMENPMANREYISKMVGKFRGIAGGNNQLAASYLAQTIGVGQTMAERIMLGGEGEAGFNEEQFAKRIPEKNDEGKPLDLFTSKWIEDKALENYGTTPGDVSKASWDTFFQENGEKLKTFLTDLVNAFDSASKDASNITAQTKVQATLTNSVITNAGKTITTAIKEAKK